MTKEEIIQAISDDEMMPYIEPYQLADIVDFVIKNYKPSLPSNLDEAAENRVTENGRFEITPFEKMRIEDIMFGAEWMAGQGVAKEAVIGMDTEEISINVSEQTLNELDLCPGDKVIVQIRKK